MCHFLQSSPSIRDMIPRNACVPMTAELPGALGPWEYSEHAYLWASWASRLPLHSWSACFMWVNPDAPVSQGLGPCPTLVGRIQTFFWISFVLLKDSCLHFCYLLFNPAYLSWELLWARHCDGYHRARGIEARPHLLPTDGYQLVLMYTYCVQAAHSALRI